MRDLQFPELPRQWSDYGYEIDELLGQGSYGAVYRMVKNKGTDKEEYWALKVIKKNLTKKRIRAEYHNDKAAARRDFGEQFNKLAKEVNMLETFMDEKHIVQIQGSCLEKMPEENYWYAYIQMEYLMELMDYIYPDEESLENNDFEDNNFENNDLKNVDSEDADSQNTIFELTEERMDTEEVIRLGIEICQALEVCHKENVLHRDIKPENIMVAKDRTFKLGDFGLAREWDDGSMTVTGTRNYMAPEVYDTFYDKSADIYSLGMVLYYFANDMRLPFWDIRDSIAQMNARAKGDLPEPEKAFGPMRRIILKACALDPKDRYQSAADMRADLENAKLHPYGFCPVCGNRLVKRKEPDGIFLDCEKYQKDETSGCSYSIEFEKRLDELNNRK